MRLCSGGSATALLVAAVALGGCGDDDMCGPADAPAELALTGPSGTISYGSFTASANNDCPPPGGSDVTSVTIEAAQTNSGFPLTLCLPRPDALGAAPAALELDDGELVQLIDLSAQVGDCTVALDRSTPPAATAAFAGFCDNGTSAAGFALTLSGAVSATESCPDGDTPIELAVSGTVAVGSPAR